MNSFIKNKLRIGLLNENIIEVPNLPNSMNFWHGGNLDEYSEIIAQKNGRYEYGPGLYLITQFDVAKKYAKGSRKLYIVTVEKGHEIGDVSLNMNNVISFVNSFVLSKKRKEILGRFERHIKDGYIKADIFNNIILNEKAIKASNTNNLRQFLVSNGIDYELVHNPFGWGETMMVLYNMKKIIKTTIFGPKDRMENYNFKI